MDAHSTAYDRDHREFYAPTWHRERRRVIDHSFDALTARIANQLPPNNHETPWRIVGKIRRRGRFYVAVIQRDVWCDIPGSVDDLTKSLLRQHGSYGPSRAELRGAAFEPSTFRDNQPSPH